MVTFHATFTTDTSFPVSFGGDSSFGVSMGSVIQVPVGQHYEGAYEVTPNLTTQILPTEGLAMWHDVVVNPIPSNYGLITWDGAKLTVS